MPERLVRLPLETRASKSGQSGIANPSQWVIDFLGAAKSVTGIDVHETVAMQANAVYACVLVLAETMGTIPLVLYHRSPDGGKQRAPEHPLYRLLHDTPNPEMTSVDFRQSMMGHRLLWGNAYAEIERDVSGRPIALWPLRPDRMAIWRSLDTKQLEYWYSLYTGGVAVLQPEQVLHLKNLSIDGIRGMSPIAWQREAVAGELALEQFANSFFGNDATPGGFLSHPGTLSDKARENIKKGYEAAHKGLTMAHRMAVFEEGITWQKVGVAPEDAQFLASRQFSLTTIARMYRVPMHLLSELGRVTHANIEHMGIDFVTHTIRPHCVNWEQAIAHKLIMPAEAASYFAEFNIEGLLRGDLASRYQSYAIGRQWGWLSPNEIRNKENMNPIPDEDGGNDYLVPLNMGAHQPPVPAQPPSSETGEPIAQPLSDEDPSNRSTVWQRLFKRELETILRREKADVLQNARKLLQKGDFRGFQRWLVSFYGEDHPSWMRDRLLTLFEPEEEAFAQEFLEEFTERYSQRSLQALQGLLQSQNGESMPALEAKFADWEQNRALETVKKERFRLRIVPETRQTAQNALPPAFQPQIGPFYIQPPPPAAVQVPVTVQAAAPAQVQVPVTVEAPPPAQVLVPVTVEAPPAPEISVNANFQPPPAPNVEILNTFEAPATPPAPNLTIENMIPQPLAPNVEVVNRFEAPPSPPAPSLTIVNEVSQPAAPMVEIRNTYESPPAPQLVFNTTVEAGPAPNVEVPITVQGAQITNEIAAPVIENTFQPPQIEVQAPVIDVKAPISVENTFQPPQNVVQVQPPDVTVMPTQVNITVPAPPPPEPSRGVKVLYDEKGRVIGTEPRSAEKKLPPKLKAQKAQLNRIKRQTPKGG